MDKLYPIPCLHKWAIWSVFWGRVYCVSLENVIFGIGYYSGEIGCVIAIPDSKVLGIQHGAHLGPVGPSWAPCWPHGPCYRGYQVAFVWFCIPPSNEGLWCCVPGRCQGRKPFICSHSVEGLPDYLVQLNPLMFCWMAWHMRGPFLSRSIHITFMFKYENGLFII